MYGIAYARQERGTPTLIFFFKIIDMYMCMFGLCRLMCLMCPNSPATS